MNELLMAELSKISAGAWVWMVVLSVPPFLVFFSKRVNGGAKWFWVIMTGIFSWLAYAVFLYKVPKPQDANRSDAGTPPP